MRLVKATACAALAAMLIFAAALAGPFEHLRTSGGARHYAIFAEVECGEASTAKRRYIRMAG